ncbi:hypothetical protein HKBW3C_02698 [Candidatus Hakubella thermalkaliphila]|nr:hypothetical protein HKBW3C_02698 [Candidatus Hakubella thermalkaliphila]
MKNPFKYGEVVVGEDFADRQKELAELVRDLRDGQRIFLISPRRYGKTSLIMNALMKLKEEGLCTIYLDLYRALSLRQFLEQYASQIAQAAESKLEKAVKVVREILPGIRPNISIAPDGTPSISIDYVVQDQELWKLQEEVYNTPEKLAARKGRQFVVVFDEFQEIANLDGEKIEKAMRASFQHHKRVAYLFAGSKRHLIYDMISDQNRAFYKMGKVMALPKIPREEFSQFLQDRFKRDNFTLENGVMEDILEVTEEYPYNTQFLCHEIWNFCLEEKVVKREAVDTVLNKILERESPIFLALWEGLSVHQRQVLQAIATGGGEKVFSKDFLLQYHLGALSSVQTSIRLLRRKDLLDKEGNIFYITDVFFKEWVKRKMV